MSEDKATRPNEIQTRRYYVDAASLGPVGKAMAEARDAGVPSRARMRVVEVKPEGFMAALMTMTGEEPRSYVEFTWEG